MGDRMAPLRAALASLDAGDVVVVWNGAPPDTFLDGVTNVASTENLGVPGGRDRGLRAGAASIVAFLDDDAEADAGAGATLLRAFDAEPGLGAVSMRLVDEDGVTARRHVPRFGDRDAGRAGDVATFLGGACAIRREAYEDAGGYWDELFYGHEELELSWRLIDRGWSIHYLADATVFHPRTEISRHAAGWNLTGRNRVMIARRTLPWPVALTHVTAWLVLGLVRAPDGPSRGAYLRGWAAGWRLPIDRSPIAWRTVWRLVRLGRPPVI